MRATKKPLTIDYIVYEPESPDLQARLEKFAHGIHPDCKLVFKPGTDPVNDPLAGPAIGLVTMDGSVCDALRPGTIIAKGPFGDIYPIAPDVFEDTYDLEPKTEGLTFGEAIEAMRIGAKVQRDGWNGKGMFVVLQKGYPDGIAINQNTADALGIPVGTVKKFRPYPMLYTAQGDFVLWSISNSDALAEDWRVI